MRGADLPKSASAPAAARKPWRMGLVPRPTLPPGNGRERPHLWWQQLIIFLTLNSNILKKVPCVLLLYTVRMNTFAAEWYKVARLATKVAGKWYKVARYCLGISAVARPSLECQVIVFPQFPLCEQHLLRKQNTHMDLENRCGSAKKPFFCYQVTPLPDPIRRVDHGGQAWRMPAESTFF